MPISAYQYVSIKCLIIVRDIGIQVFQQEATVASSSENELEMKNIEILFVGLVRGTRTLICYGNYVAGKPVTCEGSISLYVMLCYFVFT